MSSNVTGDMSYGGSKRHVFRRHIHLRAGSWSLFFAVFLGQCPAAKYPSTKLWGILPDAHSSSNCCGSFGKCAIWPHHIHRCNTSCSCYTMFSYCRIGILRPTAAVLSAGAGIGHTCGEILAGAPPLRPLPLLLPPQQCPPPLPPP